MNATGNIARYVRFAEALEAHQQRQIERGTFILKLLIGACLVGALVFGVLLHGCEPRPAEAAEIRTGTASYYGLEACQYNPDKRCPTASGKSLYALQRQHIPYAAMYHVPFGTHMQVCRADKPSVCTEVVIEDRGPNVRLHRLIDLNPQSFKVLTGGSLKQGIIPITLTEVTP